MPTPSRSARPSPFTGHILGWPAEEGEGVRKEVVEWVWRRGEGVLKLGVTSALI